MLNHIALVPYQYHCVVVFSCPMMAVMVVVMLSMMMMPIICQSIRNGCGFCWTLIVFRATHRMFAWFHWICHRCDRLHGAISMIVRLNWASIFQWWWWWRWHCTLRIRWNILTLFIILLTIKEDVVYPILEIISLIFMGINYFAHVIEFFFYNSNFTFTRITLCDPNPHCCQCQTIECVNLLDFWLLYGSMGRIAELEYTSAHQAEPPNTLNNRHRIFVHMIFN